MDKKRLEYYKKKLATRREELLRGIARTQQEGREADEDPTVDLADKAANSYTKEFLFGQTTLTARCCISWTMRWRESGTVRSGSAYPATRSFSRSGARPCPGPATASPARRKRKRGCSRPLSSFRSPVRSLAPLPSPADSV